MTVSDTLPVTREQGKLPSPVPHPRPALRTPVYRAEARAPAGRPQPAPRDLSLRIYRIPATGMPSRIITQSGIN